MATDKKQRNPVLEIFGAGSLLSLPSSELRAGLEKLRLLGSEAGEQIAAIRKNAVDGIINGESAAIGAVLHSDDAMDQALRWQRAIQTAIEAAEQAFEIVSKREKDAELNKRRARVTEAIDLHNEAAAKLDKAIINLAKAFADYDLAGMQVVRASGVRMSGNVGALYRADHTQHLISLGLHDRTEGMWYYDRVPPTRGYIPVAREANAMGLDVLGEFEERIEHQINRMVEWTPVVLESTKADT